MDHRVASRDCQPCRPFRCSFQSVSTTGQNRRNTQPAQCVSQSHVLHLVAVSCFATLHEVIAVIDVRKRAVWFRHMQKVCQRLPTCANVVLEQVVGRDETANLIVVRDELRFAVGAEITLEEDIPEF